MLAYIAQKIIQGPLRISYKISYRLIIRGHENLKNIKKPMLIVSNHQSYNDAFLVASSLPFLSPLFPLRYMAATYFRSPLMTKLYRWGVIPSIYYIFGAILLPRGKDLEGKTQLAIQNIQKHKSVVIFPEGGVVRDDAIGDFKQGVAIICQKTEAPILPVVHRNILINGIRKKVIYFAPIYYPKGSEVDEIMQNIRSHFISLYDKLAYFE